MDAELREAFQAIREEQRSGFTRLEGKIDSLQGALHEHLIDSAGRHEVVSAGVSAAHRRIDELREERRAISERGWALWLALVMAGLSALGTLLMSVIRLSGRT